VEIKAIVWLNFIPACFDLSAVYPCSGCASWLGRGIYLYPAHRRSSCCANS